MSSEQRTPSEEELAAAFEEQMSRVSVTDVLVQTVVTLVNLAARRLGLVPEAAAERDLEQARLAIEAVRAVLPLCPEELGKELRQPLSQLQMRYAQEAGVPPGAPAGDPAAGPSEEAPKAPPAPSAGAPPQGGAGAGPDPDVRSRIWTPPGV